MSIVSKIFSKIQEIVLHIPIYLKKNVPNLELNKNLKYNDIHYRDGNKLVHFPYQSL